MTVETNRLTLVPLTAHQLKLWVENIAALEKELACSYDAEPLTDVFLEIVKGQLTITENDELNYLFHGFWLIIRKEDRVVVGSADFKALPDANGEVEIGYGLGKKHEHHGYMTEAVQAMCNWAMSQQAITHVIAETENDNIPSQNILTRCGFTQYKQADTLWWKL